MYSHRVICQIYQQPKQKTKQEYGSFLVIIGQSQNSQNINIDIYIGVKLYVIQNCQLDDIQNNNMYQILYIVHCPLVFFYSFFPSCSNCFCSS